MVPAAVVLGAVVLVAPALESPCAGAFPVPFWPVDAAETGPFPAVAGADVPLLLEVVPAAPCCPDPGFALCPLPVVAASAVGDTDGRCAVPDVFLWDEGVDLVCEVAR